MSDLRASVLKVFSDQLAVDRARSRSRLDRAAADGAARAAYAREQRIVQASCDLEAVSGERWQELADWLEAGSSISDDGLIPSPTRFDAKASQAFAA